MSVERLNDRVFDDLLTLNNDHKTELSLATNTGFRALWDESYWARHIQGRGFLIAFDHRSQITGENYDYLSTLNAAFVYVDRIVVSPKARGMGYARELYDGLFRQARRDGHRKILCEINIDPPNPGSVQFHGRMGFDAVRAPRRLSNGKTVQYFEKTL